MSVDSRSSVYADVPEALERWRQRGITVWIYSSGSIAAQKLLFDHTQHGSLLKVGQALILDLLTNCNARSLAGVTVL